MCLLIIPYQFAIYLYYNLILFIIISIYIYLLNYKNSVQYLSNYIEIYLLNVFFVYMRIHLAHANVLLYVWSGMRLISVSCLLVYGWQKQ